MKIKKHITVRTDVEIDLNYDDIAQAMNDGLDPDKLVTAIGHISEFLNNLSDEKISELSASQKEVLQFYLIKQSKRFG